MERSLVTQYYEVPYFSPGLGTGHELIALRTTNLEDAIKEAESKIKDSLGSIFVHNVQILQQEDCKILIKREWVVIISKDGEKKYREPDSNNNGLFRLKKRHLKNR